MGLRDSFLGAERFEEIVSGPVGDVLVRSLTVGGKDRVQNAVMAGESYRPVVIRECFFDPTSREPVFVNGDDVSVVPAAHAEPYIEAALRLSALPAEEVEELEGN